MRRISKATPVAERVSISNDLKRWRRFCASVMIGAVALLIGLYWDTVSSLSQVWWESDSYTYGFAVPVISLWLIWRQRDAFRSDLMAPSCWGLAGVMALVVGWWLADLAAIQLAKQLCLALLVAAIMATTLGLQVTKSLAFPLGYLLLAVPVWSALIPVLQDYTAVAAVNMLRSIGVPVFKDGYFLSIPTGEFRVAEYCAGFRYLIVSLVISALYAYLYYRSVALRAAFVSTCVGASIVANWLRVVFIVWLGHVTEMRSPIVYHHHALGWVAFGATWGMMLLLGAWLQRFDVMERVRDKPHAWPQQAAACPWRRLMAVSVVLALVLLAGRMAADWTRVTLPSREFIVLTPIAPSAPWKRLDRVAVDWRPQFMNRDAERMSAYTDQQHDVALYLAYYHHTRQGHELINDRNTFYNKEHWWLVARHPRHVALREGGSLPVQELILRSRSGESRLVWCWYVLGVRPTSNPSIAKLWEIWRRVSRQPGAAAVGVATTIDGGLTAQSRQALEGFLHLHAAAIHYTLRNLSLPPAMPMGETQGTGPRRP